MEAANPRRGRLRRRERARGLERAAQTQGRQSGQVTNKKNSQREDSNAKAIILHD